MDDEIEEIEIDSYKFSRKQIARHKCLDCNTNVIEAGDYCLLRPDIWQDQFGLKWEDNLCIACIEKRLRRKLTMLDFCGFPHVEGFPPSEALMTAYRGFRSEPRRRRKNKQRISIPAPSDKIARTLRK
jgi:hypothetical protein